MQAPPMITNAPPERPLGHPRWSGLSPPERGLGGGPRLTARATLGPLPLCGSSERPS